MLRVEWYLAGLWALLVACRPVAPRPEQPQVPAAAQPTAERSAAIAVEALAKLPSPGLSTPRSIQFSPDGAVVTYLDSPTGSFDRQLFGFTPFAPGAGLPKQIFTPPEGGATEANLSSEEKLRRERQRQRGLGVTQYAWAKQAARILLPLRGDLWVQDGIHAEPRKVVDTATHPAIDAQFSGDGEWIAYVMDDELYVVSSEGGAPKQLTQGARGSGISHGLAEYIAQEEMGRQHGFWWSQDATQIAFAEVDERHIPRYRISHSSRERPSHEDHAYPFAGAANAKVRLGVVARSGGEVVWLDLASVASDPVDFYLARVHWMPAGDLIVELENRAQSELRLVRFDPSTGSGRLLFAENSEVWINLHDIFEPLRTSAGPLEGGFLWASERSGYRHLYLVNAEGNVVRRVTSGQWMVDEVVCVDEARAWVYFLATEADPRQRHLYRSSLKGGALERLTKEPGTHHVVMDRSCDGYVDLFSSTQAPPRAVVRKASGGAAVAQLPVFQDPRVERLRLRPPEMVSLSLTDGTTLYGAVYRPEGGPGPFPTVVSVYGGPHAQRVQDNWRLTADLRAQFLREQGYLVFKLDNRGSARRGLTFEGAIRHDLGNVEVQDQTFGVEWLVERGLADPDRVAIYGWSYGGYLAAMALARAPETFAVGVAGAPVSSWDGYDTHYTERYMGAPGGNRRGYEASSVMTHVASLRGKLLLVHGLIDENVHFRHTARLMQVLISAGKHHELLLFPGERHMPRAESDRVYMERRIWQFLRQGL